MKRILIANDLLIGGGVENVLENMVQYLLRQGEEVTLLIPNCSEQRARDVFGSKINVYPALRTLHYVKRFSAYWFWDRGVYLLQKLLQWVRLSLMRYDVVIALKEGPTMQEAAWIYGKKKLAWIHTDYRAMHWTVGCFRSNDGERKCMQRFDHVVCVSEAAKESVIQTIGDPGNLCVKYNPIDCPRILQLAQNACTEPKPSAGLLFVSIGRLAPQKNYPLLLDVCSELAKTYDFTMWIVGEGPQRKELEEKIREKSIKCVRLMGNQTNPYPYLRLADVYVSSSSWESYGLAVQEALVLGKPVVAIQCPAIEETLDPRFGILAKNSFDGLYLAMERMLVSRDLRQKCADKIAEYYPMDALYEKRIQDICCLWE